MQVKGKSRKGSLEAGRGASELLFQLADLLPVIHIQLHFIHIYHLIPTHEPALRKAHPPLARLSRSITVQPLNQTRRRLLTHLNQVLSKVVYRRGQHNEHELRK